MFSYETCALNVSFLYGKVQLTMELCRGNIKEFMHMFLGILFLYFLSANFNGFNIITNLMILILEMHIFSRL